MDNPREAQLREVEEKSEMNPETELKANPNAASESATVNGGAAATPSATKIPERVDFKIHSGSLLVEFARYRRAIYAG